MTGELHRVYAYRGTVPEWSEYPGILCMPFPRTVRVASVVLYYVHPKNNMVSLDMHECASKTTITSP